MSLTTRPFRTAAATLLLAALPHGPAVLAQASFSEAFDDNTPGQFGQYGPASLVGRGWLFRTQSEPPSLYSNTFFDGYITTFSPQAGEGYLAADYMPAPPSPSGATVSNWAILPPIPGQAAGDVVALWVRRGGALPSHLEIRYAPSGGSDTGSGAAGVGDFTALLLDVPVAAGGWHPVQAAVPGPGRLALRHTGEWTAFSGGLYVGIDTLTVGPATAPCYANCDHSSQAPVLNVADFSCFLSRFAAGEPYANCDGSVQAPVLNVADFSCFLQKYAAGCP